MAILHACPKCHKKYGIKTKVCSCGCDLSKLSGKIYWIEYYLYGKRKRERIGPHKMAAEQRQREVLSQRTEGRYIRKAKEIKLSFDQLSAWYKEHPEIKNKKSYDRDLLSLKTLSQFFGGKAVQEVTTALINQYRDQRSNQLSRRKKTIKPATVNRELACLRHMFLLAERDKIIENMPFKEIHLLDEDNKRNRLLSQTEYEKLIAQCVPDLARIVMTAYYTAMRQGEILNLTWDRVDLKNGVVRLRAEDTKNKSKRTVPLTKELIEILDAMPRHITGRVFTVNGKPVSSIKKSFASACTRAGIEDFTFHDLRHTAINNWRLQGHDYFRIMAASGHKTMDVFKRYNTVTDDEIRSLGDVSLEHNQQF